MEKVLLFFSGGNDSTLSACILASKGYDVQLITFDNGCEEGLENIRNRATVLEKLFEASSTGKIHNLGVYPSAAAFMNIRYQSINLGLEEIFAKYGNLNQNQINCLNCRSSMYVVGIAVARRLGIKYIAEGARKTQHFALEQKEILDKYAEILKMYDIELLLPVLGYESDYDVENNLMLYSPHFWKKVHEGTVSYEAKCFLGCPMDKQLTSDEIEGYGKFFDDLIVPTMQEDIENFPSLVIDENVKNPVYGRYRYK